MCGGGTQTTTTKTEIPPDVLARYNSVNARAETAATTPFQQYGGEFVAGLNPTQQAGIQGTSDYSQSAQPYFQAATQGLQQAGTAGMAGTLSAYQPLAQGYAQGQQYSDIAGQLYGQIPAAVSPYYQMATQGLGAGLQYAGGLNAPAIGAALAAPYQAAPLQAYGAGAITGAPGAAQGANYAAMRSAMGAQRQAQPYYGAASELTGAGAGNVGSLTPQQIAQYQDPYVQSVVSPTLQALRQQQGQERSAQQAQAIKAGAFGGDRAGLERANLSRQQELATSQAIAPLYSQAYQQAVQTAQGQQGVEAQNLARQLQAGQQYAGIGQALYGQGIQGAQTLSQLGQNQYNQQLGAGQAASGLGQQLYGQGAQQAQLLSGLGQTGFGQQLQASQQAASLGQGITGLGLQTGQALQGLGQQLYGQGAGTAQQEAALAQQLYGQGSGTAQALAGLGTGSQAAGLQGAQAQLQAGTLGQQTQQAQDTALYQQFLQERGYPYQQAQFLANIAMGTGALSGNTQTQTAPASFFSDERLKHDKERVGEMHDGTPIYRFKYNGSDHTQIGLMAQDVEKRHPEAVGESQGYKTVDYEKATDEAAHKANGGGIMPSWMGGAVAQPGHYAIGGIAENDLSALLAQQGKSFGPHAQAGLYTGSAQANPYSSQGGGSAGYVPAGNLHVPKMLQASGMSAPKQQSTASELYSNLKSLDSIASDVTGTGLFKRGREAVGMGDTPNPPATNTQTASNQTPVKALTDPENPTGLARGGLVPRGHYTSGGVGTVIPGQPDEQKNPGSEDGSQGDVLAKVVKEGAAQVPNSLPQSGQSAPSSSSKGPNPLGLAASGISAAKGVGSIGSGIGSLASGLGAGAEAAGAGAAAAGAAGAGATAAGAAGTAAGAAGAAGGIGSALGSIGTGIAQVLPFLAMLSDERTKHNKREVGKLYDGQPVYSYDFGDGRTQIGLMAQNVERKHPEAVAETEGGLKMVDYHRATERAAHKGHFEHGGLVPREHHDGEDGNVVGESPKYLIEPQNLEDMPEHRQAMIKTIYGPESGGRYDIRYGGLGSRGKTFDTGGNHPNIAEETHDGRTSTAAGAGQFLKPTWDRVTGGAPMTKGYQDAATFKLAADDYSRRTGRDLDADLKEKGVTPEIKAALAPTWLGLGKGSAPSGGVLPSMSSITKPVSDAAEGVTGFLGRNKDVILPVLQGLGAMAGSKSRFLGSAILEGLGAGAKSYSDLQGQTAQTTGQEATNQQIMQNLAFGSIKNVGTAERPIHIAMLKNGQMIPLSEWMEKGGELIGGEAGANYAKFLAKNTQTQAAGRGIEDVGAYGKGVEGGQSVQKPLFEAAPPPAPIAGINADPKSWSAYKSQELKDTTGMGAAEASAASRAYIKNVTDAGQAANKTKPQTNEMLGFVSDIGHGGPGDRAGANAGFITYYQGKLNDIAERAGLPNDFFGGLTTSKQALEKLAANRAQIAVGAAGEKAYASLEASINSLPSVDKTAKANFINQATIMADRQRQEDQYHHAQVYGKQTGNLYNRASEHFEKSKDSAEYNTEINTLIKFMENTEPYFVKKIINKDATPNEIDEFFEKKYGVPRNTKMSRYFQRQ
jgi:muramidase (phage lysozyme)